MVLQDPDRDVLRDGIPFAPAESPAPAPIPVADRVAQFSQRWRVALTLVFGTLIATAAFFAYQAQRGDDVASSSASGGEVRGDGLAPVVADMGGDDDGGEATSPAPAAPATVPRSSTTTTSSPVTGRPGAGLPAGRSSTTATRGTAAAGGGTASVPATSSRPPSSASTETTATPTSGTQPATTPPPPTAAPTTVPTTPPTTASTTTTTAPRPVFIGDRVSYDDWDGAAAPGVVVNLLRDSDRNGVGEQTRATTTSGDSGSYGFTVEPGCYVVQFVIPAGQRVVKGDATKAVCLASGESSDRVDLVLGRPTVPAPGSCEVQTGGSRYAGVEVRPAADGSFAPSYAFYDSRGRLLLSTTSLGGPDDVERFPPSQEWTSRRHGFEESNVASVAAEDGLGNVSARVTCGRVNVG